MCGPAQLWDRWAWLSEELPGVGRGRLGSGPGRRLAFVLPFRVIPGPAAGSCANACYLSPGGPGRSSAERRQGRSQVRAGRSRGHGAGVGGCLGTSPSSSGKAGTGQGLTFRPGRGCRNRQSAPSFKSQDNPGSERGGEQTESQSMPPLGISRIAPSWEGQKPDQGSVLPLLPLEADAREAGGE